MIIEFNGKRPKIHPNSFVAETAVLIGDVTIEENANIWFGAVLRGDINSITVGEGSNVQDNTVIHVDYEKSVDIGKNVTIGHSAVIHGCKIEEQSLIGMGATVLDGAVIGRCSIVGANALVLQGKNIEPKSLVGGLPAKKLREVNDSETKALLESAEHYQTLAKGYKK